MKSLSRLERWIARLEKTSLCLCLSVMLVLAFLQVALRNLFNSGIDSADIIIRHLVLFLLFFGASLSTRDKRHLQMDISSKLIPSRLRPVVDVVINAFCILITVYLSMAAYTFAQDERSVGSTLFANVPTWYFMAIMPIGFALITLRFSINLIDTVLAVMGKPTIAPIPAHTLEEGKH